MVPSERHVDKSLSSTTAMNMLIVKKLVPPGTPPAAIYNYCKLFKKDAGRARYHVLVRDPSREELSLEGDVARTVLMGNTFRADIAPFIITDASIQYPQMWGKVLLRVRCTQGHSSSSDLAQRSPETRPLIRIGQTRIPGKEYPMVLMHATLWANYKSIRSSGLRPGGMRRSRDDN